MTEMRAEATARLTNGDCQSTVELVIPAGTSFEELVARPERLVEVFRQFSPKGCERCLSGRDFLVKEMFEQVVNVKFGG